MVSQGTPVPHDFRTIALLATFRDESEEITKDNDVSNNPEGRK